MSDEPKITTSRKDTLEEVYKRLDEKFNKWKFQKVQSVDFMDGVAMCIEIVALMQSEKPKND